MTALGTRALLTAAAALMVVAAVAPNASRSLLWALLPAALLLSVGLLRRPAFVAAGAPRHASTLVVASLGVLVALTAVGAVATRVTGLEPGWLAQATGLAGLATVLAISALGVTIAVTDGPRPAGLLLAVAVPIGLALDAAVAAVIPVGFFLQGLTIAFLLLALALLRLARAAAPST